MSWQNWFYPNCFFLWETISVSVFLPSLSHNVSCSRSLLKIGNKIFHLRLLKLAAGSRTPFRGAVPAAVGCTPRPGHPLRAGPWHPAGPAAPAPRLPPRKFFPFSCLFASSFQLFGCFGQHAQTAFNQAFPDDVFFPFFFPFSFKPCKKGAAPCWFLMPCWCSLELQELGRCCPLAARCCGPHGDAHSTCLGSLRSSPSVWCWQGTCHHTLLLPGTGFALWAGAARPAGGQPA